MQRERVMKLQYLGTAAAEGWPGLFCSCEQCEKARVLGGKNIRTRSQAVLYTDNVGSGNPDEIMLIDLPADTYMHVLQHGFRLDRVGHLLITHSHDDHFAPYELGYRCGIFASPPPSFPLHVYGNDKVRDAYNDVITSHDHDKWPLGIHFHLVESFKPFNAGAYIVTPLSALHDRSEQCFIYMIEHNGKRMLYGNDTGIFPEETWGYIAGKPFDLISLDCTSGYKREGTNHMGLPDAIDVKRRLSDLGCLKPNTKIVLHHFSHNGGPYHDAMVALASPHAMDVSYDGGVWDI